MTTPVGVTKPLMLTSGDREVLSRGKITRYHHPRIAHLWEPFREAYMAHLAPFQPEGRVGNHLWRAFKMCSRMMLDLDRTYWAFTLDQVVAWRKEHVDEVTGRTAAQGKYLREGWSQAAATLYFLGVLPYSESIYRLYHAELGRKWVGEEEARAVEKRFMETARSIGYQCERQVRKRGLMVLFAVMAAAGKRKAEELTKADFEDWETHTGRSPRVASSGVTMAQRVLAAMGFLKGEPPRSVGGRDRKRFDWGKTPAALAETFERFLGDLSTTRRPGTVRTYWVSLRRFGDWLGTHYPSITSAAEVRREHIEAYKKAVAEMRIGQHVTPQSPHCVGSKLGHGFAKSYKLRALSCVKAFFAMIDVLDYPEKPGRQLFLRGDLPRVDSETPRFIPEAHWHDFVSYCEGLTPEIVDKLGLPLPFERSRAVLAVLVECGLRANELCRLDTTCIGAAEDVNTRQATYWLRVPTGKLHNDRVIPIRNTVVDAIDAWMKRRGPQPLLWDERTGKQSDFLFTCRAANLTDKVLNDMIEDICLAARIPRFTSHQFRHTLAVQWRKNGMRIETISHMLGHKDLKMTLRYAAIMPERVRKEFDEAFAAIEKEHRTTAQVRVFLSLEAHVEASRQWREAMWVDLGIGFCGLSAFIPCDHRLACLPCPNFIPTRESLPVYQRQRNNLVELSIMGEVLLPPDRHQEISDAVDALGQRITEVSQEGVSATGGNEMPRFPLKEMGDGPELAPEEAVDDRHNSRSG